LSINAGTGLVNLMASPPGTYTVTNTIAASGGCPAATATSTITINAPQVATFNYPGTPYCQTAVNPSPILTGGAISGTFSSTIGLSINSSTGLINLSASTAGTYTVTNTIPASGGCPSISATSTITIVAMPVVTVNSPSICLGQTATLTAGGATTYSWSTTATTTSINVTPPVGTTTYTVTGTTSGCTATIIATVTVNSLPTASGTGSTVCSGSTINLSSAGGGTYSWAGPNSFTSTSQNPNISPATVTDAGTYTVTVSNGICTDTAMVTVVVNPAPAIVTTGNATIMLGSSTPLTASGGTTYTWGPSTGLNCTGCSNPIATPTQTTTYCVLVSNGTCSDSSCVTVNVEMPCPNVTELEVPDAFSPNGDGINDLFIIQGWSACMKEFKIFIYDRWGEKVFESEDADFNWDGTYKGKALDPAVFVYYIKATFTNDVDIDRKGNITLIR
jgi:gliding motility-associated-like protein